MLDGLEASEDLGQRGVPDDATADRASASGAVCTGSSPVR
ncbi:uncharacterized protein METZ01_LOCUS318950, partial [marine metagenome]